MNTCLLILKFVQFFLSTVVLVFCVIPSTLVMDDSVRDKDAKPLVNLPSEVSVSPTMLFCYYDEPLCAWYDNPYVENRSITGFTTEVTFQDDVRLYGTKYAVNCQIMSEKSEIEGCRGKLKDKCFCWHDKNWYLIFAISFCVSLSLTSLCDACSMWAAEDQDERVHFYQGATSCICSLLTGAFMVAVGAVLIHFTNKGWPYKYLSHSTGEYKYFYQVPWNYTISIILAFSFVGIMVVDGAIYLLQSAVSK